MCSLWIFVVSRVTIGNSDDFLIRRIMANKWLWRLQLNFQPLRQLRNILAPTWNEGIIIFCLGLSLNSFDNSPDPPCQHTTPHRISLRLALANISIGLEPICAVSKLVGVSDMHIYTWHCFAQMDLDCPWSEDATTCDCPERMKWHQNRWLQSGPDMSWAEINSATKNFFVLQTSPTQVYQGMSLPCPHMPNLLDKLLEATQDQLTACSQDQTWVRMGWAKINSTSDQGASPGNPTWGVDC